MRSRRSPLRAAGAAIAAAVLFGATTPIASVLAQSLSPLWLSAALYLGVGALFVRALGTRRGLVARADLGWVAGSALVGGVAAPVLLVIGLRHTDAATASLLLAVEPPATALIAWLIVREHAGRRTVLGMLAIASGAAALAWRGTPSASLGSLAVLGAALCWGADNNLAARIVSSNAVVVTGLKGLIAGCISALLAVLVHDAPPAVPQFAAGALLGLVGYGISLVLFMGALRSLGAARTSAYFAIAPFVGATIGLGMARPANGIQFAIAGGLMALGVWLHVSERHDHDHVHDERDHAHLHRHDEHHRHEHAADDPAGEVHVHRHRHPRLAHRHAHAPDIDHRHLHA